MAVSEGRNYCLLQIKPVMGDGQSVLLVLIEDDAGPESHTFLALDRSQSMCSEFRTVRNKQRSAAST